MCIGYIIYIYQCPHKITEHGFSWAQTNMQLLIPELQTWIMRPIVDFAIKFANQSSNKSGWWSGTEHRTQAIWGSCPENMWIVDFVVSTFKILWCQCELQTKFHVAAQNSEISIVISMNSDLRVQKTTFLNSWFKTLPYFVDVNQRELIFPLIPSLKRRWIGLHKPCAFWTRNYSQHSRRTLGVLLIGRQTDFRRRPCCTRLAFRRI